MAFLLCWKKNIFSSTYRYQLQFDLNELNRALEYTLTSIFYSAEYRAEVTRNIITAESPDRCTLLEMKSILLFLFLAFPLIGFSQKRIIIKFCPVSLVDELSFPTIQSGVEINLS